MYTYAMRRLVEACNLSRTLPQVFLPPATITSFSKAAHFCSKHVGGHNRQFASAVVASFSQDNTISHSLHVNRTALDELKTFAKSKRSRDPRAWSALLDLYLPGELRKHQIDIVRDAPKDQSVRDIQDVPLILEEARGRHPNSLDLLSYLGIHQKRWKAVVWLMKAILGLHMNGPDTREECDKLQAPFWPDVGISLDDLTWDPIWADDIIRPLEFTILDHETLCEPSQAVDVAKAGVGQVWQSIAYMILHSADFPEGDPESKVIMSHVFQIFAHIHHINSIPGSEYIDNHVKERLKIQWPPTLNIFSSQITAILSDTARRAHDLETTSEPTSVRAKHEYKGYGLSGGSRLPHLDEVNIGIWLDLILWSCIEGGWVTEAAWIAAETDSRRTDRERSWSVGRWENLKEQDISQTNSDFKNKQENSLFRMDEVIWSPAVAQYGGEPSLVNVPRRTISREVVVALLDGLASMANPTDVDSKNAKTVLQYISTCQRLLATEDSGLETHVMDCIVVRLVEEIGFNVMQTPKELERILSLSLTRHKEIEPSITRISAKSLVHKFEIAHSAIWLGLLRHNLYLYAKSKDINSVLRTFYSLQCRMDDNRRQLIQKFVEKVKDKDDCSDSGDETKNLIFLSQIPVHVLGELLTVVTDERLYDFGKWLLYSNDVDGTIIPPESYSQPNLQPALLHFAAATADMQLQFQTIEKLNKPLSRSVLRALLHCQIFSGKWDSAEQLILYIRDSGGFAWRPLDVATIAKAILIMERDSLDQDSAMSESIKNAFALLQKFFAGEFIPPRDSHTRFGELQTLNQLYRMLKTCSGTLSNLTSPYSETTGRATSPSMIPVDAFNQLLEGLVERDGSAAGIELWELWCLESGHERLRIERPYTLNPERVVQPNLKTLRIILRPIIEAKKEIKAQERKFGGKTITVKQPTEQKYNQSHGYQTKKNGATATWDINNQEREHHNVVQWACEKFKRTFGLSQKEIHSEFPKESRNAIRKALAPKFNERQG